MGFNLDNYEDVDTRLHKFWEENPNGRVETEIVYTHTNADGKIDQIIIKATAWADANGLPIATGFAEEVLTNYGVNKTSMIENCETSSLGRCLSNGGYSAKGQRASRTEMEKVERLDEAIKAGSGSAAAYRAGSNAPSEKQRKYAMQLLAKRDWLIDEFRAEKNIEGTMDKYQTGEFISWLQDRPVTAEDINRIGEPIKGVE